MLDEPHNQKMTLLGRMEHRDHQVLNFNLNHMVVFEVTQHLFIYLFQTNVISGEYYIKDGQTSL